MNIVILDAYACNPGDLSWERIKNCGTLKVFDRTSADEIVERAKDAEIVLTNKVVLSAETLSMLPNLKYIGVLATGYNVVDVSAAAKRGIIVTNVPAYSTDSVVQMTFAHVLNVTNQVAHYADGNRLGRWCNSADFCYWDSPQIELAGKIFGIFGLGNIGMKVALVALAFGMKVFAVTSKLQEQLPHGVIKVSRDELFSKSDIISLHCPLNDETKEVINAVNIAKMKKSAVVINTGRGPLVNEDEMVMALENERIAAYCADVLCQEPPLEDNPLLKQSRAFITPHIAWASTEARKRLVDVAINNVECFLNGEVVNKVN